MRAPCGAEVRSVVRAVYRAVPCVRCRIGLSVHTVLDSSLTVRAAARGRAGLRARRPRRALALGPMLGPRGVYVAYGALSSVRTWCHDSHMSHLTLTDTIHATEAIALNAHVRASTSSHVYASDQIVRDTVTVMVRS